MNKNNELVVHFEKRSIEAAAFGSVFVITVLGALFFHVHGLRYSVYTSVFKYILGFSIASFVLVLLYGFVIVKNNQPMIILNQNGIWVWQFGFISWQDVEEMNMRRLPGTPLETIYIRLKNNWAFFNQASLAGKLKIFWASIFGYPLIEFGGLEISNSDVMAFAQKFMKSAH